MIQAELQKKFLGLKEVPTRVWRVLTVAGLGLILTACGDGSDQKKPDLHTPEAVPVAPLATPTFEPTSVPTATP